MVVGSRLGFGVSTVALVALAATGTAVLVSHGTNQLRLPGYHGAPRTPQALPGGGAPVVVPRFPGSLVFPPQRVSVPVTLTVSRPVVSPPQVPVVPAPPVGKPPVVPPPVVEPPVVVPPVAPPPPVIAPPPPVIEPDVKHPRRAHQDQGKHLAHHYGQLKHPSSPGRSET